jgi:hypothetical protein
MRYGENGGQNASWGVSENFALKAKAPLGGRQKLITLTRALGGDSAHVWGLIPPYIPPTPLNNLPPPQICAKKFDFAVIPMIAAAADHRSCAGPLLLLQGTGDRFQSKNEGSQDPKLAGNVGDGFSGAYGFSAIICSFAAAIVIRELQLTALKFKPLTVSPCHPMYQAGPAESGKTACQAPSKGVHD